MNPYPVNLDSRGRKVLHVGAGEVVCRKLDELHRAGADITAASRGLHPDAVLRANAPGSFRRMLDRLTPAAQPLVRHLLSR